MVMRLAELAFALGAVVAFLDALRHSAQAFELVGRGSRTAWLAGLGVGAFLLWSGFSLMLTLAIIVAVSVYLVDIRHQLASIEPRR